jgi:hypothetical protein
MIVGFLGSNMLKRWKELAEPSLCSCLQSIPGVYTRAEILHEVNEENEEDCVTPQNELEGLKKNLHSQNIYYLFRSIIN